MKAAGERGCIVCAGERLLGFLYNDVRIVHGAAAGSDLKAALRQLDALRDFLRS